jgi:hypothetical protein
VTPAEALAALGDTPDAVAETLRAGGWRGSRKACGACPVAVYLRAQVGGEWSMALFVAGTLVVLVAYCVHDERRYRRETADVRRAARFLADLGRVVGGGR